MKILLIGASGQVGQELVGLLSIDQAVELIACDRTILDITNPEAVFEKVKSCKPEVIINAAAYTAVDKAETESNLAHAVNASAPGYLAKSANQVGASLIHLSTDYVFNGQQSVPYREENPCHPLGVYGRTKLAGEQEVQAACDRSIILRTAWVYGTQGKGNFVKTILRLSQERDSLSVVYDQIGTPTWAHDIAQTIVRLIPKLEIGTYGTYHFTNSGVASWYDFAVEIAEISTKLGMPQKLKHIEPITTAEYPTPAQRPAYSVLGCEKITAILESKPPHWRQSLRKMMSEICG